MHITMLSIIERMTTNELIELRAMAEAQLVSRVGADASLLIVKVDPARPIEAIKALRVATGMHLVEAKNAITDCRDHGIPINISRVTNPKDIELLRHAGCTLNH